VALRLAQLANELVPRSAQWFGHSCPFSCPLVSLFSLGLVGARAPLGRLPLSLASQLRPPLVSLASGLPQLCADSLPVDAPVRLRTAILFAYSTQSAVVWPLFPFSSPPSFSSSQEASARLCQRGRGHRRAKAPLSQRHHHRTSGGTATKH